MVLPATEADSASAVGAGGVEGPGDRLEEVLVRTADVYRCHRREHRVGRAAVRRGHQVDGRTRDLRRQGGIQRDIETPDVAVEIADVRLADEPGIRRTRRNRVGLKRILQIRAVVRGGAVVDGFRQSVAGHRARIEHLARFGIEQIERRARLGAAAILYLGEKTPLAALTRLLQPLYWLSYGKLFFDPIYNALVVLPLWLLAQASSLIDEYLIDGTVDVVGRIPPWVSAGYRVVRNEFREAPGRRLKGTISVVSSQVSEDKTAA